MTIYQVRTATKVYDSYQNLHEAQLRLAEYAIDRRNKFGVRLLQMSEDRNSFSYLIGWEEVEVRFYIDTIEVK